MSQLVKLLRAAGRASGRSTAGFGARTQEQQKKRILLFAAVPSGDSETARAAVTAGADAIEVSAASLSKVAGLAETISVPIGVNFSGGNAADKEAIEKSGAAYVVVGTDAPASIFLLDGVDVVIRIDKRPEDTELKVLNFLPNKAVEVEAPNAGDLTVEALMVRRVERELISKPLILRVDDAHSAATAETLSLMAPNAVIVPEKAVSEWREALLAIKEPDERDDDTPTISLRAPAQAAS